MDLNQVINKLENGCYDLSDVNTRAYKFALIRLPLIEKDMGAAADMERRSCLESIETYIEEVIQKDSWFKTDVMRATGVVGGEYDFVLGAISSDIPRERRMVKILEKCKDLAELIRVSILENAR